MDDIIRSSVKELSITLTNEKLARQYYQAHYAAIKAKATRVNDYSSTDDFSPFVLEDSEYASRFIVDGVIPPRPTNSRPADLPAVHTQVMQNAHKILKDDQRHNAKIIKDFNVAIINSLSAEVKSQMEDILNEQPNSFNMPYQINNFLKEVYSQITETEIKKILKELDTIFNPEHENLRTAFNNMIKLFKQLADIGQSISEYEKLERTKKMLQNHPKALKAYWKYRQQQPLLQSNFANMAIYIVEQEPMMEITAEALGYMANITNATNIPHHIQDMIDAAVQQALAYSVTGRGNVGGKNSNYNGGRNGGRNGNNNSNSNGNSGNSNTYHGGRYGRNGGRNVNGGRGRGNPGRGRGNDAPTHYCYQHGHNFSHHGSECEIMLADPTYFTSQYVQARGPTVELGGSHRVARAHN